MEKIVIKSDTLENALKEAGDELDLPIERLNYRVINEKRGLFKKSIELEVTPKEIIDDKGYVSIINEKFLIENPKNEKKPAAINIPEAIEFFVDGERVFNKAKVLEENNIHYHIAKKEAKRNLNIKTSDENMRASLWITYEPEINFSIKDCERKHNIDIELIEKERIYPPKFTKEEIKEALRNNGITFGIKEDVIDELITKEIVEGTTIAEGIKTIDDVGDRINIFFAEETKAKEHDDLDKVDYRNFYDIANVESNQPLGEIIQGSEGKDGVDIFGKVKKRKTFNKINLKVGEGCYIKDNKVYSSIAGRPCVKGGVFYVYKVFNQDMDVDVKSGNIHFIGDVHIRSNIKDGMTVSAGNTLIVEKNVEGAFLTSKGEMTLKGTVIRGRVIAGGDNTLAMNEVYLFKGIKEDLSELINVITQIKERNLNVGNIRDGEIIQTLLESKFKTLGSKVKILLVNHSVNGEENEKIKVLLKTKLFSLGVIEIKSYNELYEIIELLDSRIKSLSSELKLPVNLYINYTQDSNIESSGDIIFTGKGAYLSNISAQGSIYFKNNNSVIRGGLLKAQNEIKCKIVGSEGGGKTTLITSKTGHIYADVVYMGTKFVFGKREYIFDAPCRNVHGYLDQYGDVNIDKFVL